MDVLHGSASSATSDEESTVIVKLNKAVQLKKEGNEHYKKQDIKKAIRLYHHALMYIKGINLDITSHTIIPRTQPLAECPPALKAEINAVSSDLHNNIAACMLKQTPVLYERVIEHCKEVISDQPNNVKALYRMALSYHHLRDNDTAKEVLKKAITISEGKDMTVRKLLISVDEEIKKDDEKFKSMFRNTLDSKKL